LYIRIKFVLAVIAGLMMLAVPAHARQTAGDSVLQSATAPIAASAYDAAMAAGSYAEAEVIAKERIAAELADGKQGDLSLVSLYTDLAHAQQLGTNLEAALRNYAEAVSIVENNTDNLNLGLERPLRGMGEAQLALERPDRAVEYLDRSVHVRQVNVGPHDVLQVRSLEPLAYAHAATGNVKRAEAVADRVRYLLNRHAERNVTPGDNDAELDVVKEWLALGLIYRELDLYEMERTSYNQVVEVIESDSSRNVGDSIEALVRIGESLTDQYFEAYFAASAEAELPSPALLDEASSYFAKATDFAEQREVQWAAEYRAHLARGDFHTLTGELSRARHAYRKSWALITGVPGGIERRRQDLEQNVPLLQPLPAFANDPSSDDLRPSTRSEPDGYIVSGFTIDQRGRPGNVELLEIAPERDAEIEAAMKERLASFVYRPRMKDGFVVVSPGQQYRLRFHAKTRKTAD